MKFFDKVINALDSMVEGAENMAEANLFLNNNSNLF